MKNNLHKVIIAVALIVVAAPFVASAWTSAPPNPPNSNVAMPINTGDTSQSKSNYIMVNSADHVTGFLVYGSTKDLGKVGIGISGTPQYKLQVGALGDGSTVGASAFFYTSDAAFKKDVSTLDNALNKVLQLRGVSYTWKSTGQSDIGLIAQEVEKIYPEAVTGEDGSKAIDYGHLVGPLVEAVKAQQKQIDALKARVQELEARK